jgi:hypothetical protein
MVAIFMSNRRLILDRGGHGPGVIVKENPGETFEKTTP